MKTVLFVGSFANTTNNGSTGGQMFACKSLLNSHLSNQIKWILIDSTATLPEKPLPIRALKAARRVALVSYYLATKKIDTTLIFSAHGASFAEKGVMCILSSLRGRKTIFAPRSGLITNDLNSTLKRRFIRHVFSKASVVICQSPYWKALFESVQPNANYTVVHNWIDHTDYEHTFDASKQHIIDKDIFYTENKDKYLTTKVDLVPTPNHDKAVSEHAENRAAAQTRKRPIKLFFLGWVTRDKGIFELIDATINLAKQHPLELHIGGHGDAFDEIELIIKSRNAESFIFLHGWMNQETKLRYFQESDIYVQPTHFEGFSNALLEAMCCKLPIVCSDIPAISSLVQHNVDCLLFKVKDTESLISYMEKMINDPELQLELANNAYQLVIDQFSIHYGVKQFENLL